MPRMSYIIVTRNPSNKKLVVITNGNDQDVAEYGTESEAHTEAFSVPLCRAWNYKVVKIEVEV